MTCEGDADVAGGGEGFDAFGGIFGVDVAGFVFLEPGIHCVELHADETFQRSVFEA